MFMGESLFTLLLQKPRLMRSNLGFLSKDMTYSCAIFPDLDTDLQPSRSSRSLSASSSLDGSSQPLVPSLSPSPTSPSSPPGAEPLHQKFEFPSAGIVPPEGRELSGSSTPTLVSESEMLLKRFKAKFGGYIRSRGEQGLEEDDPDVDDDIDDELYEAQMRKLSHIVRKCAIRPGMRVSLSLCISHCNDFCFLPLGNQCGGFSAFWTWISYRLAISGSRHLDPQVTGCENRFAS